MHSIEQLKSGELIHNKHIKLSCGLKEFPEELFASENTLETLDLSGNQLSSLPHDFYRFKKLKILFCSDNLFTELPKVLGTCEQLEMIGFKSNQISVISEKALPIQTRWLILTNNKIKSLPSSIGNCFRLQKVALAGNLLSSLPEEMANCKNLELLRISANQFQSIPDWLVSMPKLAWLAVSGNRWNKNHAQSTAIDRINWNELDLKELLGEGASGHIYKSVWRNGSLRKDVAVKVFKGDVTSDGYPEDEMQACIGAGKHPNLYGLLGTVFGHPQQKLALVMNLISSDFKNLGGPPSLSSCTRDTFESTAQISCEKVHFIVTQIAEVASHLHSNNIMHGDLYAHNILINANSDVLLGDFGAASFYDTNSKQAAFFQKIEVRAWACLLDDLLNLVPNQERATESFNNLSLLRDQCMQENVSARPDFKSLLQIIDF